jgi:hypothetical protein
VLVVGKDALSRDTIQGLDRAAKGQGMQPLFSPGEYETLFAPLRKGGNMASFIQSDADYNLAPTSDDQPYFFNLDYGLPPAIRSTLVMSLVLAVGLLALVYLTRSSEGMDTDARSWPKIMYALLIGMGFMLVEIPLIQRFQLLLGQPILSLAVLLATLLLSSGVGSLVSQRWQTAALPARVRIAGLWIVVVVVAYWFALPPLVSSVLNASLLVRVLTIVVLTALLGFPMGIPFPSLLRMADGGRQQVALLWAINGAFSVLGSTLAMVFSMQWGFRWALAGGALCYLLLTGVTTLMTRLPVQEAVQAGKKAR